MAGLASAVLALLFLLPMAEARAGDFFTGVQVDAEGEYFSYLGIKDALPWEPWGLETFGQVFSAAQSYEYESGDDTIDANVQSVTPSLGLARSLGDGEWKVSLLAGPEFEWKREEGFPEDQGRDFDVGVLVQAEAHYWQAGRSLHAIFSYASLDDFFFGRVRGKRLVHSPKAACCAISAGYEVAGMGNDDYRAVQTGPIVEVSIQRLFVVGRLGYQNDSNVGSSGYGGVEIYVPF